FEPIGLIVDTYPLVVARKNFPPNDLREFTAYVKANGPALNMAHGGVGSMSFNQGLLLSSLLGVRPTYVPFNGTGPAASALTHGSLYYMLGPPAEVGPQTDAGLLKAYAIMGPKRDPILPKLPTAAEAGLPDFVVSAWFALFAPKGTPEPILDKLSSA